MTDQSPSGRRLDSWKAIADYLQRDVATARRWEKSLGLPVRRVAGNGRSVFAYASEIDQWLGTSGSGGEKESARAGQGSTLAPVWRWVAAAGAVALIVGVLLWPRTITADDLHVEMTPAGVVARDSTGGERWRHEFPATLHTGLPLEPLQVLGGTKPGVYLATAYRGRQLEDQMEGGALTLFDLEGRPQHTFSFPDEVRFDGKTYGAPWAITDFAVDDSGGRVQVAVTAHHYVWDPGVVTVLDDQWRRRGTFVHAGWLEQVRWVDRERLVVAGYSNAHEGGMVALLDAAALDGQGPEPSGSRHHCEGCGEQRPLRMIVFPRSEVNQASASRFNRASVQTFADGRLTVHSVEMSSPVGDAAGMYEFSPSLDLLRARFSDRYWDIHATLEAEGKIAHPRERCPDRDGPTRILIWEPASGWRTVSAGATR